MLAGPAGGAVDCLHLHSVQGPGCPWCGPGCARAARHAEVAALREQVAELTGRLRAMEARDEARDRAVARVVGNLVPQPRRHLHALSSPDAFGTCGCPCGCMNGADGRDNLCSACRSGRHGGAR